MQAIGEAIKRSDIESELAGYLKLIPEDKLLNFETIRDNINSGSGGFSDVEGILLLLESIVRRSTGETEW
ncbi:MAG: hypothetical protein HZA05_03895 [Nitrospirae bacterium]|nr:hypothetical protein [Nitrospirota bacterium]